MRQRRSLPARGTRSSWWRSLLPVLGQRLGSSHPSSQGHRRVERRALHRSRSKDNQFRSVRNPTGIHTPRRPHRRSPARRTTTTAASGRWSGPVVLSTWTLSRRGEWAELFDHRLRGSEGRGHPRCPEHGVPWCIRRCHGLSVGPRRRHPADVGADSSTPQVPRQRGMYNGYYVTALSPTACRSTSCSSRPRGRQRAGHHQDDLVFWGPAPRHWRAVMKSRRSTSRRSPRPVSKACPSWRAGRAATCVLRLRGSDQRPRTRRRDGPDRVRHAQGTTVGSRTATPSRLGTESR